MTRETKVGLLVGMGVILLIGIIVSDHLAVVQNDPADLTEFVSGDREFGRSDGLDRRAAIEATVPAPPVRRQPVPTPEELEVPPGNPDRDQAGPGEAPLRQLPVAYALRDRPTGSATGGPGSRTTGSGMDSAPTGGAVEPAAASPGVPTLMLSHETPPVDPTAPAAGGNRFADAGGVRPAPTPPPSPRSAGAEIVHYVKAGETLYEIAERYYGNGEYWRTIATHNADKILPNGHVNENVRLVIPNRAGLALGDDFVPVPSERAIRIDPLVSRRAGPATIEVEAGDTLSALAAEHLGSAGRWRELLEANRDRLSAPEQLRAGMTLTLPGRSGAPAAVDQSTTTSRNDHATATAAAPRTYTVRAGDTLFHIAERTLGDGDRWRDIYDANRDRLKSPDAIVAGQELRLPR